MAIQSRISIRKGKVFPWLALHCSPPLLRGTPPQRPLAIVILNDTFFIVILNDIFFIVILNGEAVKDPGPRSLKKLHLGT